MMVSKKVFCGATWPRRTGIFAGFVETSRVFYLLPERRNDVLGNKRTTPDRALPTDLIRKSSTTSLAQEWQMMVPDLSGKKQTNKKNQQQTNKQKTPSGSGACKQEVHS